MFLFILSLPINHFKLVNPKHEKKVKNTPKRGFDGDSPWYTPLKSHQQKHIQVAIAGRFSLAIRINYKD